MYVNLDRKVVAMVTACTVDAVFGVHVAWVKWSQEFTKPGRNKKLIRSVPNIKRNRRMRRKRPRKPYLSSTAIQRLTTARGVNTRAVQGKGTAIAMVAMYDALEVRQLELASQLSLLI